MNVGLIRGLVEVMSDEFGLNEQKQKVLAEDMVKYLVERYLDGTSEDRCGDILTDELLNKIDDSWLIDYRASFDIDQFTEYYEL